MRKKLARFLSCTITGARNLHILQITCTPMQVFSSWMGLSDLQITNGLVSLTPQTLSRNATVILYLHFFPPLHCLDRFEAPCWGEPSRTPKSCHVPNVACIVTSQDIGRHSFQESTLSSLHNWTHCILLTVQYHTFIFTCQANHSMV